MSGEGFEKRSRSSHWKIHAPQLEERACADALNLAFSEPETGDSASS
jgi:hypothetical protein